MAVFHSLLVPLDGSEQSDAACTLALQVAAGSKADVTFVNVVESEKIVASTLPHHKIADPTIAIEQLRASGKELLRKAQEKAQSAGMKARSELAEGDCVDTIVELAKSSGADLIVMGSHGRGGLERLLLGSVAEGVLRKSPVPVMIVRAKAA